jgi:hypothetical protein
MSGARKPKTFFNEAPGRRENKTHPSWVRGFERLAIGEAQIPPASGSGHAP